MTDKDINKEIPEEAEIPEEEAVVEKPAVLDKRTLIVILASKVKK